MLKAVISMLLLLIVNCVSMWRVYVKAGVPGWYSLIPIVNIVYLFKIAQYKPWVFLAGIVCEIISLIVMTFNLPVGAVIAMFSAIILFAGYVVLFNKLFMKFGLKAFAWIFAVLLCPAVGLFVIAFNPQVEYDF